jgi:hypothetical protein
MTLRELRELRFGCVSIGVGIEGARLGEVSLLSVTPQWVERMKALGKLEKLRLQGCNRINDESVRALIAMPALREVDLQGTSVTAQGAAAIRAAKPGAIVYVGPWDAKSANYRNN